MINNDVIDSYNNRLTFDYTTKSLSETQKDKIRHYGSLAEALIKNRDLGMFIHHYKFEIADQIAGIRGHTIEDNNQRIALSNELVGIDGFVNSLKRAIYYKEKLGKVELTPE